MREEGLCRVVPGGGEERHDAFLDLVGGEGFADIAAGSGGQGSHDEGFAGFGGDHDDGDAGGEVFFAAVFEELEAVHGWHVDVGDDEVEVGSGAKDFEGFDAVSGFEDAGKRDAGLAEGTFDDLSHYGGVVDDESAHGWDLVCVWC